MTTLHSRRFVTIWTVRVSGLAALAALLPVLAAPALAQDPAAQPHSAEHQWLKDNFSGPFVWRTVDPDSGREITGSGHCEMIYGDRFLRCVHRSPTGEELGVGLSGYDVVRGKNQWLFYGSTGTGMLFGEGGRDAEAGISVIEGTQQAPGMPEFTFRTVTRQIGAGVWSYTHYRVDGDTAVEMYHATFEYERRADGPR